MFGTYRNAAGSIFQATENTTALSIATHPTGDLHTDMSTLQVKHSEWRHGESTVTVTVRKGQARLCFRSEEALHTRGTVAKPKRTRRTAGLSTASKVRHCKDESMVIEASRWAVFQTEATPDSIITHWITLWKQLSEWER